MEKPSKTFDKKFQIISKIQSGLRRKKIEHLSFLDSTTLQFPPINSVSLTFPISKPERAQAVHSIHAPPPNLALRAELERLFEKNHLPTNGNVFNRIIFTNPLKTRFGFESSLRTSFLRTLEQPSNRSRYRSLSKDKISIKTKQSKVQSPKKQEKKIVSPSPAAQPTTPKAALPLASIFDLNPEKLRETQAKLTKTMRQTKLLLPRKEQSTIARYSPWGGHENDDELII